MEVVGERGGGGLNKVGTDFIAVTRSPTTANFVYVILLTKNVVICPTYANEKLFL